MSSINEIYVVDLAIYKQPANLKRELFASFYTNFSSKNTHKAEKREEEQSMKFVIHFEIKK